MSETANIFLGGVSLLVGLPFVLALMWLLWAYWWLNIPVWIAVYYFFERKK